MSLERNMIGFELGTTDEFTSVAAGTTLQHDPSGTSPRSGQWFMRMAPSTQQSQASLTVDAVVLTGAYAGSGHLRIHVRFFMRINALPTLGSPVPIYQLGTVANFFLDSGGVTSINFTGHTGAAGPTLSVDGLWHQIDLDFDMDGGTPSNSTWTLSVDSGAATTVTLVQAGPYGVGAPNFGINTNATFSVDIDDYIMFSANLADAASPLTMPTRTHILPVPIVAQGGTNQWTGSYLAVQDVPPSTSPDTFQSSATPGQIVTWQKDLHQWNNLSGTVQGIKLYYYIRMQGSGSASVQNLINGAVVKTVTTYPLIPAAYPTGALIRGGFDWTEYSLAAYDALELGCNQNGTLQANAGGIFAEVLSDVTATPSVQFITITPNSGPTNGGQTVTFTGFFSRTTDGISFGGAFFAITSLSSTQIVGTTSAHVAGVVDITVGANVVMPKAYTYISSIAAIIFQVPTARYSPGHNVERRLDNQPGLFKFEETANVPAGTPLQVQGAGATTLINGVAVRTTRLIEAHKPHLKTQVEGTDRQYYLNKMLVVGNWIGVSASDVCTQILANFAPDFSPAGIVGSLPAVTVQFSRDVNVGEALTKICSLIQGHWYLDLQNTIHVYTGPPSLPAPDVVDDNNQNLQNDPPIQVTTDLSQIRNRVYVRGRGNTASIGLESPVNANAFNLTNPIDLTNIRGAGSGIVVAVYWGWTPRYLGYYLTDLGNSAGEEIVSSAVFSSLDFTQHLTTNSPPSYLGFLPNLPYQTVLNNITGLIKIANPHDPRVSAFRLFRTLQFGNNTTWYKVADISIDSSASGPTFYTYNDVTGDNALVAAGPANPQPTTQPATDVTVYTMQQDTTAQANLALIEGGDGVHEYQINDPSLQTTAQAIARAQAELALFANPIVTLDYYTRDQKSLPGAVVHFNLSAPPIVGDFQIQQVTIEQVKNFRRGGTDFTERYHVVASSVRFTLDDLFRRVLLTDTPSSAGSGGVATTVPTGAATGTATPTHVKYADQLWTARNINGVPFDGTANISVPAAMDHMAEVPTGAINGVNTVFTTAATYQPGKLAVYRNGVRQAHPGDYSETTSTTFTFVTAPSTGDTLLVDYESA